MAKPQKSSSSRAKSSARSKAKSKKKNNIPAAPPQRGGVELVDPLVQAQMKTYEEAMSLFHQQKFQRAKQELEKVLEGPSKELADRARTHLRIVEQRMSGLGIGAAGTRLRDRPYQWSGGMLQRASTSSGS